MTLKLLARFSILSIFAIHLTACTAPDNIHEEKITIAGSSTMLPISENWASEFREKKDITVNVQGGGSTHGIKMVLSNKVDIAASSRELTHEEQSGLKVIPIGKDALAVVVHNNNKVDNLTVEEVRKIFSGKIDSWSEVGGVDRDIQVINRESGSGTRTTFEEIVMCKQDNDCKEMLLSALVLNSNAEVKRSVGLIEDSIGYISLGFVDDSVKSIDLNGIQPSVENVVEDRYPVSRNLYYAFNQDNHSKLVDKYISYVLSDQGQKLLYKQGFLPRYSHIKPD